MNTPQMEGQPLASAGIGGVSIWLSRWLHVRSVAPGLLLCMVIGMAAAFVETRWGGPRVLYALLMGMAFHELSQQPRQANGVHFSAQTLLRLGIGLLGARITFQDMSALGWPTACAVVAGVLSTLACVAILVRTLGLPWRVGVIAGGATAICGASAALALASVAPKDRETEHRTLAIAVCATTLSTLAMLSYPLVCKALGLSPKAAGLMLGGSIHDVAQVVVASYTLGPVTGDVAVIIKLLRIAMLALILPGLAWATRRQQQGLSQEASHHQALMPWFMQLFMALAFLQTLQWLPVRLSQGLSELSQTCLAIAAAGLGMRSSVGLLRQAGWRIVTPMLLGSLWLVGFMICAGYLLLHPH